MIGKNMKKVMAMVLVLLMTCSSVAFARGGDYGGTGQKDPYKVGLIKAM